MSNYYMHPEEESGSGCLIAIIAVICLILIVVILGVYTSNPDKEFTGHIVAREYTPGHMCHSESKIYSLSFVHVPHTSTRTTHHHKWEKSKFIWFVANKNEVRNFYVDSLLFYTRKCGEKVTMKL